MYIVCCSEDPPEVLRLIYTHSWVDLFQPY